MPKLAFGTNKCFICATFMAVTLKVLMGHYFAVHSNEPNFFMQYNMKGCPATFRRYHSFHKHFSRSHRSEYGAQNLTQG